MTPGVENRTALATDAVYGNVSAPQTNVPGRGLLQNATRDHVPITPGSLRIILVRARAIVGWDHSLVIPAVRCDWDIRELFLRRRVLRRLHRHSVRTVGDLLNLLQHEVVRAVFPSVDADLLDILCELQHVSDLRRAGLELWSSLDREPLPDTDALLSVPGILNVDIRDARLGPQIRAVGIAEELSVVLLRASNQGVCQIPRKRRDALQRLVARAIALSKMSLVEEYADLCFAHVTQAVSAKLERNEQVLNEHFFYATSEKPTLEELGQRFAITRERVRQICRRRRRFSVVERPFAPAMDRVIEYMRSRVPVSCELLQEELLDQGRVDRSISPRAILELAADLGRETGLAIDGVGRDSVVRKSEEIQIVRMIEQIATRRIRRYGVAQVSDVVRVAESKRIVEGCNRDFLVSEISVLHGLRWLSRSEGWFTLVTNRRSNPLLRRIRKVLCVAPSMEIAELRRAVRKDIRLAWVPASSILLEYCRKSGICRVEGTLVFARRRESFESVLRGDEREIVRILVELGPLCRRTELQDAAKLRGVSSASFWQVVNYRPTVMRFAKGVYGLVGSSPSPAYLESLIPAVTSRRVVQDHGWTHDGCVWVAYTLSKACIENGILSIPAAKRDYIQGTFPLRLLNSNLTGNVTIKGSSAWGLGPIFRRLGVEANDVLALVFDCRARTATARIGDDGILDELTST